MGSTKDYATLRHTEVPVVNVYEDKPSGKAILWAILIWGIALACMLGGATMWIIGSLGTPIQDTTVLQVVGNVMVAYFPIFFCAWGACKCMTREKQVDSIV